MQKTSSLSHAAQGAEPDSAQATPLHPVPAQPPAGAGRPSLFSDRMAAVLCSIVRTTGISDSGAAARASLHPSTVSRWKREYPDFAILLRAAREEFRATQLELIMEAARSGSAGGWRAASWLLERTFPQEYSPRAQERARFQEMEDAAREREADGLEGGDDPALAEMLQNLQNATLVEPAAGGRAEMPELRHLRSPLQNVQNTAPAHEACGTGGLSARG